jgi:large subunit ribosomal protein L32
MAALPKKKISKSRGRKRYATKTYRFPTLSVCSNCGAKKLPHIVCPSCGFYSGKAIIEQKEEIKVTKVTEDK